MAINCRRPQDAVEGAYIVFLVEITSITDSGDGPEERAEEFRCDGWPEIIAVLVDTAMSGLPIAGITITHGAGEIPNIKSQTRVRKKR